MDRTDKKEETYASGLSARLRRLKALVVKESRQVARDPSSILIAFVLPLLLLFLYGYGLSLDSKHLRVGVVVEGGGASADSLARAFGATDFFAPRHGRSRAEFRADLVAGRIRGIIVIPADFDERLARPDDVAPIQVIADGSEPNTANFVHNYAEGVLRNWLVQEGLEGALRAEPAVVLEPRVWYNAELRSQNFLVPGSITIIMALIGTLLTALVVSREWERGTMEALMSTPIGVFEIVAGKLIPYFVLGMGSMLMCATLARAVFDVPFRGSLLVLCGMTAVFLLAALGQGLLISTAMRNQFVAAQTAIITAFLPAVMLSGFIFEIASMPLPIRILSSLMPARYFVEALQTLFLAGDVPSVLIHSAVVMGAIAAGLFFLTARKTVKRLD